MEVDQSKLPKEPITLSSDNNNGAPKPREVIDLANIIAQPTERKEPPKPSEAADNEGFSDNGSATANADDFRAPEPGEQFKTDAPPEVDGMVDMSGDELTDSIIDLFDWTQKIGFGYAVKAATFNKEDNRALREMIFEFKNGSKREKRTATEYEKWLIEKAEFIEKYEKETLPIDDKLREKLRTRLSLVMQKMNWQATPEKALLFTGIMFLLPRILPLLIALWEKITGTKPLYERSNTIDYTEAT